MEKIEIQPKNLYRNNAKAIDIGNAFWNMSETHHLTGILGKLKDGYLHTDDGHKFINFSCCSYLDLDSHPKIIEGAIAALSQYGVLDHCIPRTRVQLPALLNLEESLSELLDASVVTAISASVATQGLLPIIASGHLCGPYRPFMIFDKNCHVSMNMCKPICADETEVATCLHHDLNFIEDSCKKYKSVCYVCDGSDSLGGYAPVKDLIALQDRYGLVIYYDDSHSLSAYGPRGQGYVRSHIDTLNDKTIIVATLNKAFGSSGAAIMFGKQQHETLRIIDRFGGPMAYSQPMNIPAIGASLASAEIHRTSELGLLQEKLKKNIKLFDERIKTPHAGSDFPIRLVHVSDKDVISFGQEIYKEGFYVSPVFFPIVARGTAGLRVMMRAGQPESEIQRLCGVIQKLQDRSAPVLSAVHS